MRNFFLLPFFLVQLAAVNLLSGFQLVAAKIQPLIPLLMALFFVCLVLTTKFEVFAYKNLALNSKFATGQDFVTHLTPTERKKYEQALDKWVNLYHLQPKHRDILINLALLNQALGKQENYQMYWQQAQILDPNYFAFQQ